ncbi:MAG: hypothetical protein VB143_02810 [Burkholderia sp.]
MVRIIVGTRCRAFGARGPTCRCGKSVNRLRFFWTRIWGKTCVWKRS